MKRFLPCLLPAVFVIVLLPVKQSQADMGFFASYIEIDQNGSQNFLNLTGRSGSTLGNFDGTDFGTINVNPIFGDTLLISNGQGATFKNGGSDVTGVSLFYSVAKVGETHSFNEVPFGFISNQPFTDAAGFSASGSGDQLWGSGFAPIDVTSGLSEGNYQLQVFLRGSGTGAGGPEFFHSNGGANYTATFFLTSVPEPTSALLFGSCLLGLGLRRRRRG